ncbi:MAG: hypothetical protein IKI57_01645 [Clostridia bacterium]|nr:hypothetical protein [Clostridia bacterium]
MGNINWFIPQKIHVGFRKREDTFTGKLGYVIYFDEKGKLRKENSWNSWRDILIPPVTYDNVPSDGFIINKNVGGYKSYYWYGFRKSYIRIFDPRGFEFEITLDNLIYILKCSNCIDSTLQGKFVYAWDGTELVLMPLNSGDYEDLNKLNHSRFNKTKITSKNIVVGGTYLDRSGKKLVYLGKFDYYPFGNVCDGQFYEYTYSGNNKLNEYIESIRPAGTNPFDRSFYTIQYSQGLCGQHYYFSNLNEKESIISMKSLPNLIEILSEEMVPDFDERMAVLRKQPQYSPVDKTKDEYVTYSRKEFEKEFPLMPGLFCKFALVGDDSITMIRISRADNGKYTLSRGDYYKDERLELGKKFVPFEDYTRTPITAKEIFDKYKFVRVNKYLQNGELYAQDYR